MNEHPVESIGLIIALGIGAQWLAWRLRLPSILLLLIAGFLAGPVFHWIHPDQLLGDVLMPLVSVSVGKRVSIQVSTGGEESVFSFTLQTPAGLQKSP